MKITKEYIKNLVSEELFKEEMAQKYNSHTPDVSEELLEVSGSISENFEIIENDTVLKETEEKLSELKNINAELKKMKHLIDFRSPLLDNN